MRTHVGGFLPLRWDAVGVFYSSSRQGWRNTCCSINVSIKLETTLRLFYAYWYESAFGPLGWSGPESHSNERVHYTSQISRSRVSSSYQGDRFWVRVVSYASVANTFSGILNFHDWVETIYTVKSQYSYQTGRRQKGAAVIIWRTPFLSGCSILRLCSKYSQWYSKLPRLGGNNQYKSQYFY